MMPPAKTESALYLDQVPEVDRFLTEISNVKELALDTEGASFHRFLDRIYLLQISTREQSAIIDPLPIGSPAKLGQLLESKNVEVVFHDADYDLRLLHQDYGWHATNIFDTRVASQLLGIKSFGLAALLEQFFEVKLDKKHQRADWSMRPLTPDMLAYAAQDTRYLLQLKDHMKGELKRRGRIHWAEEEFASSRARAGRPRTAWRDFSVSRVRGTSPAASSPFCVRLPTGATLLRRSSIARCSG